MDLEEIKADLDDTGYCIVEGVMPAEEADRMADCYFDIFLINKVINHCRD